LRTLHKSADR